MHGLNKKYFQKSWVQATCSTDGQLRIYEAPDVMNLSQWSLLVSEGACIKTYLYWMEPFIFIACAKLQARYKLSFMESF